MFFFLEKGERERSELRVFVKNLSRDPRTRRRKKENEKNFNSPTPPSLRSVWIQARWENCESTDTPRIWVLSFSNSAARSEKAVISVFFFKCEFLIRFPLSLAFSSSLSLSLPPTSFLFHFLPVGHTKVKSSG